MKKSLRILKNLHVLFIFMFVLVSAGCINIELNSIWRDREITIDGDHSDWNNALTYIEDKDVSIGLLNDEAFLYICLIPGNRQIQNQMMRFGFTIWLNPENGKKNTFGIRYPLGMINSGIPIKRMGVERQQEAEEPNEDRMHERMERFLSELEILGPEKDDVQRMGINKIEGIDIKVNNITGTFVYELKVPLVQDESHQFAVGAQIGSTVRVGFETNEIDREKMRKEMQKCMSAVRGGGFGGKGIRRGMRGGMRRRSRYEMPEPLKIRTKVHLAEKKNVVSF